MTTNLPLSGRNIFRTAAAIIWRIAAVCCEPKAATDRDRIFREVQRDYLPLIAKICYCYASTREDFDDMRQDALTNIWRGLAAYRRDSGLSTWIYRVTLNTCVSTMRRQRLRSHSRIDDETAIDRMPDDTADAERLENERILYRLIAGLNPIDKAVIMMWLDEKSYDEIAEVMGMGRNAIASRIHRIKTRLADLWPA